MSSTPRRFEISIDQPTLDDLSARLHTTRLPPWDPGPEGWDAGTDPGYLRELLGYWKSGFDWRAREARLNRLAQFEVELGSGTRLHYVHERGIGDRPFPLVLTHGWPDSFLRFDKLIRLLTHPTDPADAFDVVVPSLPGFAFSAAGDSAVFDLGALWHELMTKVLGYPRFGAHGGDWGSFVTEQLARSHASSVVGVHLTDVPFHHTFQKPKDASPAERAFFETSEANQKKNGAYGMVQSTRPQTLGDAMNDSPIGLAAWWVEKFHGWMDCDGDLERCVSKDELLTQLTLVWATQTAGTSFLPYFDAMQAGAPRWILEKAKELVGSATVPAAFALFPKDLSSPPREWAERFFNVQRWTLMPRGGHFAALEVPELLAEDLRAFFRPLRTAN